MKENSFSELPLLEYTLSKFQHSVQFNQKTVVICVQHLLETTGSLFESILKLGINKEHLFITGKLYSTNLKVLEKLVESDFLILDSSDSKEIIKYEELLSNDCARLWEICIDKIKNTEIEQIIILDDGGHLVSTIPTDIVNKYRIYGIEQTTSGLMHCKRALFPVINVAGSWLKTAVEPEYISQAIIRRIRVELMYSDSPHIGIIGFGNIGKALFKDLSQSYNVSFYDKNYIEDEQLNNFRSLEDIYISSDLIIGATGTDVSWLPILDLKSKKTLISVSSGNIEFQTLLLKIKSLGSSKISSILNDVQYKNLRIIRGGTPVNFDNSSHSVLPEHIQLTRALLLIAFIQIFFLLNSTNKSIGLVDLEDEYQKILLIEFQKYLEL